MTRKHYIAAAKMIRSQKLEKETAENIVEFLATMFAEDNPRFNKEKFIEACEK